MRVLFLRTLTPRSKACDPVVSAKLLYELAALFKVLTHDTYNLFLNSSNQGYACRWYVYKYGKGSKLEDLKFKNLRDVEDFIHSDQPGAKFHRKAMEKGKRQTDAMIEKAQRKALKRRKKEEKEEKKKQKKKKKRQEAEAADGPDRTGSPGKVAKSGGKGSRGPYYKKPKAQAEGGGARKRHVHGEESKKDKKRRKKQEGSATKSGGSSSRRRTRDDNDDDDGDDDDDSESEAEIKAKQEAKRKREARREAKRAASAERNEQGEEDGGGDGGGGTPGDDKSGNDKEPGSSSEGGGKPKGTEDKVEKEIMEIVGAYSNPEARKELLAQLRQHARQDARLHQEKSGASASAPGFEAETAEGAEAGAGEVSGKQGDVGGSCDNKTEKASPAEASTEHAPQDAGEHQEKEGTAVSAPCEEEPEAKAKAEEDADGEEVSGQRGDVEEGDKTEKVSPAEDSAEHAPQDAGPHQKEDGSAVSAQGNEPKGKGEKDSEEVEVSGQRNDVAGGEKKEEEVSLAGGSAHHGEGHEAEGGQEAEVGHKRQEKGKKKDKAAKTEQRRSPRTSGEGQAASFFGGGGGGGGGGRSSPRLSGQGQATSFGSGGGTGAGKKKRKAESLTPTGGIKRQSSGAGREDDDNRRQSIRAASAAATAAMTGSS